MKYLFVFILGVFILFALASCNTLSQGGEGYYTAKVRSIYSNNVYIVHQIDLMWNYGDTISWNGERVVILYPEEEYQIKIGKDTFYIWDKTRYVGAVPYFDNDALSKVIRADNR